MAIDTGTLTGLRDRALIATMVYTFARVSAALQMNVRDYFSQGRRGWVRLHEKGGKVNELPCHHNLEKFLDEWLTASKLSAEPTSPLFPTMRHGMLTDRIPLAQANVHMMMIHRRGHRDKDKLPQFSCDWYYHLPAERRQAGSRAADGGTRIRLH